MSTSIAVPACAICRKPVPLETAKADEDGQSVHEQCYVLKLLKFDLGEAESIAWKAWKTSDAIPWIDA